MFLAQQESLAWVNTATSPPRGGGQARGRGENSRMQWCQDMGSVWFQHESSELVRTLWCLEMWKVGQPSSYCVFFYKLKVCGNPTSSKTISTVFPAASDHFVSLCHASVIFTIYQTSSFLFYLLWWSVISDLRCYCCNHLGIFLKQ